MIAGAPYAVAPLRYDGGALAPAIGAEALRTHRDSVHAAYAAATNRLVADLPDAGGTTIEHLLAKPAALPPDRRDAIADVGGAHANHQFFWKIIGPGGSQPTDDLAVAIERDFGDVGGMQARFDAAALGLAGPGFAFLTLTAPGTDRLEVFALPGNASVLPLGKPDILVCDLCDHAWAADHADRAAWLRAFWTIVDWPVCGARYDALREGRQPD